MLLFFSYHLLISQVYLVFGHSLYCLVLPSFNRMDDMPRFGLSVTIQCSERLEHGRISDYFVQMSELRHV
jgi:hypothetical protein